MRILSCTVLIIHFAAGAAYAQTFNDLQIKLGVSYSTDHGETPGNLWRSTGPVIVGKPVASTFSLADACEAWSVSAVVGDIREDATTGWNIEVTALRVVREAITFRLRWVRFAALRRQFTQVPLESSKAFRIPNEDLELTMRPGESAVVDTLRVPAGLKTMEGRTCRGSASIRVSVDRYPEEEEDRRLVAADLWLIERLSNGSEAQRGQILSVRGLPNRPFRFYFDRVVDANFPLDIFGFLTARLESGATAVTIETRCRWGHANSPGFYGPQQFVESAVVVKPEEIVEVRLPKLDAGAGPFARREFSIRIRARQLR
jgi:hypothetical protein